MVVASMLAMVSLSAGLGAEAPVRFLAGKPVWPATREKERNVFVGFRALVEMKEPAEVTLRLTGASLYRVSVNGQFVGHGPARGPHGWFRIDELNLTPALQIGTNVVAIEVAGYNATSYYLLDQPSFLQAEIVVDGRVLAATGSDQSSGRFEAAIIEQRLQKVQRFSFQRPFTEVYRLAPAWDAWKSDPEAAFAKVVCAEVQAGGYLPRRVPYSTFALRPAVWDISRGKLQTGVEPKEIWRDRSLTAIGTNLGGYPEAELTTIPSIELQKIAHVSSERIDKPTEPGKSIELAVNTCRTVDFGTNLSGFVGATISCKEKTRLFFTFDEILSQGAVDFKRLGCANVILLELEPGEYRFEAFEPYTLRYLELLALTGGCTVRDVYLREFVNPDVWRAHFAASDVRLNRLFEAGRETFRQNATDIFMDCPSRERAGWLCDSFFTSRVAIDFMGSPVIEKNFVENYLLPAKFAFLPDGALPMCYPSDHYNGEFIPNWTMWFVVELEEYLARSNDRAMVDALRPRVMKLLEYFKPFENSDGLLQKLSSWVFVEWSAANNFTQDVNYPTNMLYAGTLAAAGRMYGDSALLKRAEQMRETIRKQSFDGEFFVDNAVLKDGKPVVTRNRTETCQYYAFFFDVGTPELHGELFRRLVEDFGPHRKETKKFAEIHPSNSFIGNMLRSEILSRHGRSQQTLDESIDYLLYMADRTGTLWENTEPSASCNHGFASHIVHTLYRDILGLYGVDRINRVVELRFCSIPKLEWCEGRMPLGTGDAGIALRWWREAGKLHYRIDTPAGWRVEVKNLAGEQVVRHP